MKAKCYKSLLLCFATQFLSVALAFWVLSLFSINLFASDINYSQTGFRKNRTYIQYSPQEFVNVFSGNVILTHTDIELPGNGGLDLKIQRTYNSKIYSKLTETKFGINGSAFGDLGVGWDLHFGRINDLGMIEYECPSAVSTCIEIITPIPIFLETQDGTIHELYLNDHSNVSSHVSSDYITEDLWLVDTFDQNNDEFIDKYVMTLPDGTVYTFDHEVTDFFSFSFYYVSSIRDKNGNEIIFEYYDCCNRNTSENPYFTGEIGTCSGQENSGRTRHIKKIIDSVGREINFTMLNNECRGNAISSIDVNGKVYNYLYHGGTDNPTSPEHDESPVIQYYDGGSARLLREVQLPVGPGWQYNYDVDLNDGEPDAELIQVKYPSGGIVDYDYETYLLELLYSFSDGNTQEFLFRALASRTTSGPNINTGTWIFDYDATSQEDTTIITDSCGTKEIYKFSGLRENSFDGGWKIGLLKSKEVENSNDITLETVTNSWTPYQISTEGVDNISDPSVNGFFIPLLNNVTITRNAKNYLTDYIYGRFYDSPTSIIETGDLTRRTDITYFENLSPSDFIIGLPQQATTTIGSEVKTINNSYDTKGNLLSEDKYGVSTQYTYYPNGNLKTIKNARNVYTLFNQYNFGLPGQIKYGSSLEDGSDSSYTESWSINWEGTTGSFMNGRGHTWQFVYDNLNRLTSITPPLSGEAQTTITYDNLAARSMVISKGERTITGANGTFTSDIFQQMLFDGFGRQIGSLSSSGVSTTTEIDQCGRISVQSLPYDNLTQRRNVGYTYDALNRIISISHPDGTDVGFTYLDNSNQVLTNNERNIDTTFKYKSFGDPEEKRLSSIVDAQSSTTNYEYDILGNLREVIQPQGISRTFNYNSKNFLISESHPESGTTIYGHDQIGNITSKIDANGNSIQYTYDSINRLSTVDYSGAEPDVAYEYDNASNRISMQSSTGSYSYFHQYDQSNRLIQQDVNIGSVSYGVDYEYDETNSLTNIVYPSGQQTNYSYDFGNRLLHILPTAFNFTYHASGAPLHFENEIGVSSDFTYDNKHRLKDIQISRTYPYLQVVKQGSGDGTITSNPLGISCGNDCGLISGEENVDVTLTVTTSPGSTFAGWSGNPDCTNDPDPNNPVITMSGTKICFATFNEPGQQTLTVTKIGTGSGTVTSDPVGIDCGVDCMEGYNFNTQVVLTPVADTNSTFTGWSGDADCSDGTVTMDSDKTCTAAFDESTGPQFDLIITKSGSGTGTVTTNPAGIDCGSDCSESYAENTQVALIGTPSIGSLFAGWTGDSDCSDGIVTMNAEKTCDAVFQKSYTLTIQKNGSGNGTIRTTFENPPRIDCGSDCTENYIEDSAIGFEIAPDPGSEFAGWSGASGCPTSPSEGVVMTSNLNCTATFNIIPNPTLTIEKQGNGLGKIQSTPSGIDCGSTCSHAFAPSAQITLNPIPNGGSIFDSWSGDPDCSDGMVTMSTGKTCIATFIQSSQEYELTINVTGFGLINASVGGFSTDIDCMGAPAPYTFQDCEEEFPINTQVNLVAIKTNHFITNPPIDYSSEFIQWTGDPDCEDGKVTISQAKTCTAVFTPYRLQVGTQGIGVIEVTPEGNTCTNYGGCDDYYHPGTQVTLNPIPNPGNIFNGWDTNPPYSADCSDGTLLMDADKRCTGIFTSSSQQFTLTVNKAGTGTGTINASGINCGADCSQSYLVNTQVNLQAAPGPGSVFEGWSGNADCSDGKVRIDAVKNCTATFAQSSQQFNLNVNKSGSGDGTVSSSPGGIDCGSDCAENYPVNTVITLTPTPDSGSEFIGWEGACFGEFTMNSNKTCTAIFEQDLRILRVDKKGFGSGTVTSNPSGIDCGLDCEQTYPTNTQVTLTAIAEPGSVFIGWTSEEDSEDCSDGVVTLEFSNACTARFGLPSSPLAYVSDYDFNSIHIINTSANIKIGELEMENDPRTLALSPNELILYAILLSDSRVFAIDLSTHNLIDTIDIGFEPQSIGVSPNGDFIYVTDFDENKVTVINTSLNEVVNTIPVGSIPVDIIFNPNGTRAFVSNLFGNTVSVIDTSTETVIQNISVGAGPAAMAIKSDGNRLYVSNSFTSTVSVIDTSSNSIIGTINVGLSPSSLAMNSDGSRLYVAHADDSYISVIDTATNAVIESLTQNMPVRDIVISPDGNTIYSTSAISSQYISVTDIQTGIQSDIFSVGTDLNQIIITDSSIPVQFPLTVSKTGNGSGTITTNPAGINCGNDCSGNYDLDSEVTLTATPGGSSVFSGWSGDPDCSDGVVTMSSAKSCTATFTVQVLRTLTVTKSGSGSGTVTSNPSGIDCGSDCNQQYNNNTQVTLTATPNSGSTFAGWSGNSDCSDGVVTMNANKSCTATFSPSFTLTVSKAGTGAGTVTSSPTGINCGADCSEPYSNNTQVTLTAAPDSGSTFSGWSGNSDCSDGVVTVNANKSCTATFAVTPTSCDCGAPGAILGTSGNNTINGTSGANIICGLGGNDTINGMGGNDCIDGGPGIDDLRGGDGNDNIFGGADNDTLRGENGNDLLDGGAGTDNLIGGSNTDRCLNGETTSTCEQFTKLIRTIFPLGDENVMANTFRVNIEEKIDENDGETVNEKTNMLSPLLPEKLTGPSAKHETEANQLLPALSLIGRPEHRIKSYLNSFKVFVLSFLFSTNAFAQGFAPVPFIDLEYSYDGVGNVTGITDYINSGNSCSMQYDSVDRLTVANGPWGGGSYTYDLVGNRTSESLGTNTTNFSYDGANRLANATHDSNGNIISDGFNTYTYDSENRLITVDQINGPDLIVYEYDADGRKIKQTVNGETTYFAYGVGLNVLTEFTDEGIPRHDYIYAGNLNVARVEFDEVGAPVKKTYYHSDNLGSAIGITDNETTLVFERTYMPYGGTFAASGSLQNTRQYTGKEKEELTQQYYYGARHYSPQLGRFLSIDPAGIDVTNPQSWNRYAYVRNNPFTFIDPNGEAPVYANGEYMGEIDDELLGFGLMNNPEFIGSVISVGKAGETLVQDALRYTGLDTSFTAQFFANVAIGFLPTEVESAQRFFIPIPINIGAIKGVRINRPLKIADIGARGSIKRLEGMLTIENKIATAKIDFIQGRIENPFQIINNLSIVAKNHGATTLRIEATLANERLFNALMRRYTVRTEGAVDILEIPLK